MVIFAQGSVCEHIGEYAFYCCVKLTRITIPNSVTSIEEYTFNDCSNLTRVYYTGTLTEWSNISIDSTNNYDLNSATRYYFSESEPTDTAYNYWHYVDGVPTPWEI